MSRVSDMLKKNAGQLKDRAKESGERTDEKPWTSGSIFAMDKIPEGVKEWKPDKGEHEIDIITFVAGSQHPRNKEGALVYSVDIWVFRNVGGANDQFVAPGVNFKNKDPIAEFLSQTRGSLSKPRYNAIRPKRRIVYLIWCHDSTEEEDKGIQYWDVSHFYMGAPLDEASKLPRGGGHILFAHPSKEVGKRIYFEIKKSGSFEGADGKDVEGIEFTAPKFIDREEDIPDHIMDAEFSLDEIIYMHPTYEEIYEKCGLFDDPTNEANDRSSQQQPSTQVPDGECPHGHKFGVDTSQMDECKKCQVWDDCVAKQSEDKESEDESPTEMTSVDGEDGDKTKTTDETSSEDTKDKEKEKASDDSGSSSNESGDSTEKKKGRGRGRGRGSKRGRSAA